MSQESRLFICIDNEYYGSRIAVDNYVFRIGYADDHIYKCCNEKCHCKAKVNVSLDNKILSVEINGIHSNHSQDDKERINMLLESKQASKELIEHPLLNPSQILASGKYPHLKTTQLRQMLVYNENRYGIPLKINQLTECNHPIVMSSDENGIAVFAQVSGLFLLAQSNYILMDGTFKVSKPDHQLYILHSLINKCCCSCVFIVMPQYPSTDDYAIAFKMVEKLGKERNLEIFDRRIMIKSDFEKAAINAIEGLYKQPKCSCCYFHYCQTLKKRFVKYGLNTYKENNKFNIKSLFQYLKSIPLIPMKYISSETVELIFKQVKYDDYDDISIEEIQFKISKFKKYYYKTWIGVQGATKYKKPIFHPSLWNVCNNKLRTNNYSEASHSVLNKYFTDTIDAIPFVEILDKTIKKDMKKLTDT